ncbi:iron-siderophore ABC transporter substrate-binding protein [uncultured Corynebacterium sp.]|uniref:iron-siderophore ABC transporter substrate-binding protein n=1 Tax=uncultured Corynebacterium sp. TaxID=159447 RepID=UPI0025E788FB|nr:iron-siderophore ABC transporter substrate-binding protein [uncultured Corynebacterium sp.]
MTSRIRRVSAAALALATAVSLAACSSDDDDDDTSSSSSSGSAGSATDSFPVSIDTKFGEVEIPEARTTVVALGWGDAEIATELGVQPVGVSDWLDFGDDGLSPWAEASYDDAPEQIGTLEPDFEKIAALEPDLILNVRAAGDEETYDKLSAIAPTVSGPEGSENWVIPWNEQTETISTALGESAKGEELVTSVDDKIADVKDAHPEWSEETATVLTKTATEWGAYVTGDARADLLAALGFQSNQTIQDQAKDTFYVTLSEENVDQADSDVVVGFPVMVSADDLANDPAWKGLTAVQDGRAFVTDEEVGAAISLGTPASMLHALDLLVPLLEDATK